MLSVARLQLFCCVITFISIDLMHDRLSLPRQGSRTPHTDPLARGAFVGLTLSHTRAHMFRAILESVCYGTRACFDALEAVSQEHSELSSVPGDRIKSDEVVIAGGATRSPLWLQLHADITGKTFLLNENTDGPLLGCAILASVGAGVYGSVEEAVKSMVRRERRIEPRDEIRKVRFLCLFRFRDGGKDSSNNCRLLERHMTNYMRICT